MPGILAAIVFLLIAVCVMFSAIITAIRSMTDSISEAHGIMMRIILLILLPNTLPLQMVHARIDRIGIAK